MAKIKDYVNIFKLRRSNFFDEEYYKQENPEVKGDAAKHYYYFGYKDGKNPSEKFDNDYYLNCHKDVKDANINPLVHYLKNGKKEKRKIRGFNGLKIGRIYHKLYKKNYMVNVFLVNKSRKINIIVENLDEKRYLFIKEIKKNVKINKIFYCTVEKNIYQELCGDVDLERVNNDYYLEIGIDDINICMDMHSLISFVNSAYINNVCMYIHSKEDYNVQMLNYIAYYTQINRVKIISSNDVKISAPFIGNMKTLFEFDKIDFVFNHNALLGLEIINSYLLINKVSDNIDLYYNMENIYYKLYLDCGKNVFCNINNEKMQKVFFDEDKIYIEKNKPIINFKTNKFLKIYKLEDFLLSK